MLLADIARAVARNGLDAGRRLPLGDRLPGGLPPIDLDGRVVLITGAARGLGAATARAAHERGAHVSLVGRTLEPLEQLADELGERAAAFQADVRELEALQRAADGTVRRFGGIDVVVANAGVAPPTESLMTIDPAEFERTVDIDLLGQWRTLRATLPAVVERRGHVLVVASIYAFVNGALNASYAASKAGAEQLARAARVELAHHGATAGVAYLGFIDTDMIGTAFAEDHVDAARRTVPSLFTAPMRPDDVADALVAGVMRRSPTVAAPWWVGPMLALRGAATWAMDEVMLSNPDLAEVIRTTEEATR